VQQKIRRFAPDRKVAIQEQIDRLKASETVRDVKHPDWLANSVLVPKPNDKWRMCMDFTDLNKAYPKELIPLTRMNEIVDSTSGCQYLCLLDVYSGYHQVSMNPEDGEKTSLTTPSRVFCYVMMPFGLKKARATYLRAFEDQIV
jgi:hypothetical protein